MSEEADISRILFTIFDGLEPQKIDQSDVVRLWSLEMQWFSPEESQSVIDALSDAGWISRQDVTLYLSDGVKLEIPSLGWRPMTRRMLSPPTYNLTEIDRSGDPASDLSQPRVNAIKDIDNQSKTKKVSLGQKSLEKIKELRKIHPIIPCQLTVLKVVFQL